MSNEVEIKCATCPTVLMVILSADTIVPHIKSTPHCQRCCFTLAAAEENGGGQITMEDISALEEVIGFATTSTVAANSSGFAASLAHVKKIYTKLLFLEKWGNKRNYRW